MPQFRGIKLAHDGEAVLRYRDVHKIEVEEHDRMLFEEPGRVGSGGNSGFQLLNLVGQFGANRVGLLGFDMHDAKGLHWYGANTGKGLRNPVPKNFVHWRKALDSQSATLAAMGIDVVNLSEGSALTCFRKARLGDVLGQWTC